MKLFGKKRPPSVVGPDGEPWVVVPTEKTESWYLMLCEQARDRIEEPTVHWVDLAMHLSFSDTVRKARGEASADGTRVQHGATYAAAKLGYQLRVVELNDLDIEDWNEELAYMIRWMMAEQNGGDTWFQNVCATAAMLMNASIKEPYSPDVQHLLAPVGAGPDMHADMRATMVNAVLTKPDIGDQIRADVSAEDLSCAWGYGYYLRACERSLPDEAEFPES